MTAAQFGPRFPRLPDWRGSTPLRWWYRRPPVRRLAPRRPHPLEAEYVLLSSDSRSRGHVLRCIRPHPAVFTAIVAPAFTRCSEYTARDRTPILTAASSGRRPHSLRASRPLARRRQLAVARPLPRRVARHHPRPPLHPRLGPDAAARSLPRGRRPRLLAPPPSRHAPRHPLLGLGAAGDVARFPGRLLLCRPVLGPPPCVAAGGAACRLGALRSPRQSRDRAEGWPRSGRRRRALTASVVETSRSPSRSSRDMAEMWLRRLLTRRGCEHRCRW